MAAAEEFKGWDESLLTDYDSSGLTQPALSLPSALAAERSGPSTWLRDESNARQVRFVRGRGASRFRAGLHQAISLLLHHCVAFTDMRLQAQPI